jgi:hypothetical protein
MTFEANRGDEAPWALAIEPGVGHAWTTNDKLVFTWAAAIAARRVPESFTPGEPLTLREIDPASGWLGDRGTGSIAGYACFTGNRLTAVWLPSEQTARDWQLVTEGSAVTSC